MVKVACGSRSAVTVFRPLWAAAAARLRHKVVLPTPPLPAASRMRFMPSPNDCCGPSLAVAGMRAQLPQKTDRLNLSPVRGVDMSEAQLRNRWVSLQPARQAQPAEANG